MTVINPSLLLLKLPFSIVGLLSGAGVGFVILADVAVHDPSLAVAVVVVGADKLTLRGRFLLFQLLIAPPVAAAVHQHHVEVEVEAEAEAGSPTRTRRSTSRLGHNNNNNDNNLMENTDHWLITIVIMTHQDGAPINRS